MERSAALHRGFHFIGALISFSVFLFVMQNNSIFAALEKSYLVAACTMLLWCLILFKNNCHDSIAIISATLHTVLGPCGALMVIMTMTIFSLTKDHRDDINWLFGTGNELQEEPGELLYRQLQSQHSQKNGARFYANESIIPFLDTIHFGSLTEKRRTLSQIARYYIPQFLPALYLSLEDPANIVRVHAASVMTLIRGRFIERELLLEKRMQENPQSFSACIALAQAKSEHIESGLLDSASLKRISSQGIAMLNKFEEQGTYSFESRLLMAHFLIRSGQLEEARPVLRWLTRTATHENDTLKKLTERWLLDTKKYAALVRYARWGSLERSESSFFQRLRNNNSEVAHVL